VEKARLATAERRVAANIVVEWSEVMRRMRREKKRREEKGKEGSRLKRPPSPSSPSSVRPSLPPSGDPIAVGSGTRTSSRQ